MLFRIPVEGYWSSWRVVFRRSFANNIAIVVCDDLLKYRVVNQARGSEGSFVPGFGCRIADAVVASCAAYPIFKRKTVQTDNHGNRELVDGSFSANNPTLLALTDALGPLEVPSERINILSLGTGSYPQKRRIRTRLLGSSDTTQTFMTLLKTSSNTVDTLRNLLFGDINTLRIGDAFTQPAYSTDFIESDVEVLEKLFQRGRWSYENHEQSLKAFFKDKVPI